MNRYEVLHGDCLEKLKELADCSVDAVVTDPPAGIAFMGKDWDKDKGGRREWIAWLAGVMGECLRVLKPGGHAFVWALPRTSHWTATALEDAGFEVRECCVHIFGSGFPKSLDVSKAIDKMMGAEREVVVGTGWHRGTGKGVAMIGNESESWSQPYQPGDAARGTPVFAPATDAARQWAGFGTALKPASEHWWLCRKPLSGTVAQNVLAHGTGAINVDGCRVPHVTVSNGNLAENPHLRSHINGGNGGHIISTETERRVVTPNVSGRWPPNTLFSHLPECEEGACAEGCAVAELDAQSGTRTSGKPGGSMRQQRGTFSANATDTPLTGYGDSGGASRFFPAFRYQAKAPAKDRKVEGISVQHPTVKPVDLMRWLVRLVTPPGGLVLDPFTGSGTTGVAALLEGFRFIGCEREDEYLTIAKARLEAAASTATEKQPTLFDLEAP